MNSAQIRRRGHLSLFFFFLRGFVVLNFDSSVTDGFGQVLGTLSVNGAANRTSGSKDFLHGTGHGFGQAAGAHLFGNFDQLIEGNVTIVLVILLSVLFFESTDDESSSRRDNRH